jgi:hypothetical protein
MAALSAVKNKKNAKLREGIEDLAVRCGSTGQGEGVSVSTALHCTALHILQQNCSQ